MIDRRTSSRRDARGSGSGLLRGLAVAPAVAALGWIGASALFIPHKLRLPPALPGDQRDMDGIAGRLSYYTAGPAAGDAAAKRAGETLPPLLLIHSINAAASAYEVKPIYERAMRERTVYALELPGFGFSERSPRDYTPRLMTDAIHTMIDEIRRIHGDGPIDALALSLSSEFLARAAVEAPGEFRSIALVSPTGLDSRGPYYGAPESNRGMPVLYGAFSFPVWGRAVFDLLNTRVSARYYLEKTWGSKAIDEGLWDYCYLTSHQPGAEHAPFYFVGGYLFSKDITRVYEQLRVPVLMTHGVRGDFTDFSYARILKSRPNWTMKVYPTGAFPQFEVADEFFRTHREFWSGLAESHAAISDAGEARETGETGEARAPAGEAGRTGERGGDGAAKSPGEAGATA
ncbi:putative alpha/beta hydrolase [Rhodovulum sp. PH10]|uniref:alpha/beta fold hydrolase n=1 Tax=Rhodovulum sp. PH10 TaxID=1187851 RepID=UPI00027C2EC9|nr:alpha/beta fold hydrolase [Rhodovulum sp. PH10]EJW09822.1 putative alpha/beta hydrolase [Rhodovulum sp. PH10]